MTTSAAAVAPGPAHRVALSLGANLGDRLAALQGATRLLTGSGRLRAARVSSVYQTEPVGGPEQPGYLNAVLVGTTSQTPQQLLALAHEVEQEYQRTRETRWGPRTLDVDILTFGDVISADPELMLPHPRAYERGFVLVPWAEVEPSAHLVGHGAVAALAAEATAREGVDAVRRTDLVLVLPS
ncbi:MAG: 2-amino-4-hydroxy-6-hydroxymethyldihydropteridine diphosphokinase [Candidatus Nanopelagicales bacterium]